jgi:hypothetical protein
VTAARHFDEHSAVPGHDEIAAMGQAAMYSVLAGDSTTVASIALELKNMGATPNQVAMTFATMAAAMLQEACGSQAEARSLAANWTHKISARSARTVITRNVARLLRLSSQLPRRASGAPGLTPLVANSMKWTPKTAKIERQGDPT